MALISLISEDNVFFLPESITHKYNAVRYLILKGVEAGRLREVECNVDAIMRRESMGSTGVQMGIAVPHAKSADVQDLTLLIGISKTGIEFEAMDGELTYLVFLMLAVPDQSGPHVQLLCDVARLTRSPYFLEMLKNAETPQEFCEIILED